MTVDDRMAYSQQEVAELLGVTRRHVADLCREGKIEHFRLGRRVLIARHVVEKMVGL